MRGVPGGLTFGPTMSVLEAQIVQLLDVRTMASAGPKCLRSEVPSAIVVAHRAVDS
jgi:hypothetical protein